MIDAESCEVAGVPTSPPIGTQQRIDSLRLEGAQRFDPVGFRFVEILSERTGAHQGRARAILDARLQVAVAAYQLRFERARDAAKDASVVPMPSAQEGALRALVRHMEAHAPAGGDVHAGESTASGSELKSVRYFRKTWSKLSADKQVTQALNQAPRNAGPINSHMVVLRSLALMRDTAPDYLNRFMSYVDTLLCLEQAKAAPPAPAKVSRGRSR